MGNSSIKSICVLRLSALGDCINAFGLINSLLRNDPSLSLKWVIDKRFASLFIDDKGTEIVPLECVDIKNKGLLKATLELRRNLKQEKFDVLFNMQTSIKASILSTAIKAKLKFGYDKQRRREGQIFFINKQVPSPKSPHVLDGFLAFANAAGFNNLTPSWDYKFTDTELNGAKELINNEQKVFAISPASAKSFKNWTVDGYIQIAKYAIEKGFRVVLLGSPSENEINLCQSIATGINNNCINLCGKTNLRQLGCVVKLSKLVLSPDSACMHLAQSQNIPVISLHAIHNPNRVGAYNFRDLEVSVYDKASKLELNGKQPSWRYRVRNEKAMEMISFDMVKEVFDKALDKYKI